MPIQRHFVPGELTLQIPQGRVEFYWLGWLGWLRWRRLICSNAEVNCCGRARTCPRCPRGIPLNAKSGQPRFLDVLRLCSHLCPVMLLGHVAAGLSLRRWCGLMLAWLRWWWRCSCWAALLHGSLVELLICWKEPAWLRRGRRLDRLNHWICWSKMPIQVPAPLSVRRLWCLWLWGILWRHLPW